MTKAVENQKQTKKIQFATYKLYFNPTRQYKTLHKNFYRKTNITQYLTLNC